MHLIFEEHEYEIVDDLVRTGRKKISLDKLKLSNDQNNGES